MSVEIISGCCCGSSSSSGGCCAGLPSTLHATCTSVSGSCGCAFRATVTLIYNSATGKWEGSAALGTCGATIVFKYYCIAGSHLSDQIPSCGGGSSGGLGVPSGPGSCDPLNITFATVIYAGTCCPGGGLVWTVTI